MKSLESQRSEKEKNKTNKQTGEKLLQTSKSKKNEGMVLLQPMERTTLEQISTVQPMENSPLEQLGISWRNFSPWRDHAGLDVFLKKHGKDPHWNTGKEWGGRSSREELLSPNYSPHSHPLCTAQKVLVIGVGNEGMKWSLEKRGWEGMVLL